MWKLIIKPGVNLSRIKGLIKVAIAMKFFQLLSVDQTKTRFNDNVI